MPKRGSAQLLLLLSFRTRAALGLGAFAAVISLGLGWFFHSSEDFPVLPKIGLAQVIREAAWEHALAGLPEEPWPWENAALLPWPLRRRFSVILRLLSPSVPIRGHPR